MKTMEFIYINPHEVEQPKREKTYREEMQDRIYHWIMNNEGERAVEVYGGVYHDVNKVINDNDDVDFYWLSCAIQHATSEACTWSKFGADKPLTVLENICHLFYVDPMLFRVWASMNEEHFIEAIFTGGDLSEAWKRQWGR